MTSNGLASLAIYFFKALFVSLELNSILITIILIKLIKFIYLYIIYLYIILYHMREIVIYYIYVIGAQVEECTISCISKK
jgi:hypothetical protein